MAITKVLPEECLALIISSTSPRDACRSSLVSHEFLSIADSDAVWERFLPSDYLEIISRSTGPLPSLLPSLSKKELYFHLCHNPIIINNGTMSFALEKRSGKKCYMIGARGLSIVWGDTPMYWKWKPLLGSRFAEVAVLQAVCWLDIKGKIEVKILSPKTTYAAYLVFKIKRYRHGLTNGFEARPVRLGVHFEGSGVEERHSHVFLDPPENMPRLCRERADGWMEIEMGEFFNENGDDGFVICSVFEVDDYTAKQDLVIEGIEFKPQDM